MKILLWSHHPADLLGDAITFLTHGTAQHAGFLRANGMIHELYLPMIRDRASIGAEKPFVRVFSLAGITPDQEAHFEKAFDTNLQAGIEYSVDDLFGFLFNKPMPDELHSFCSRYVQHTIECVVPAPQWPLVRCEGGDVVSPRDLLISPLLIEESGLA